MWIASSALSSARDGGEELEQCLSALGLAHDVDAVVIGQHVGEAFPHDAVIVGDDDSHGGPLLTGTQALNRVPAPLRGMTAMPPPIASSRSFVVVSPRPG